MKSNFPRMVHDYVERLFFEFDKKRRERVEAITTKEDMEAFVKKCREEIRAIYSLPTEKTPLNTKVTGEIKHDEYTIEKVIFESRPGFLVTANLYIPKGNGPFPCVLGTCGHANNGKAEKKYQSFCAGLATKGFITLIYDPIGQGERWQYLDFKDIIPGCCAEHITAGRQQYLLGEFFGTWRAWDGIRALDCLLERSEADPTHIGVTGNSGGGTMTTILTSLDDRFTMAAPSCFITTYRHNLLNEIASDPEQIPPGIIQKGYEEYDHITAVAPRPTIICTKEDDFFDQRGSQEAYQYLRNVYTLLGKPDDIEIFTGEGGHGFDQDVREAMYAFFCRHAGIDDDGKESEIKLHEEEEINATESGQVVTEGSRRVVDFTRDRMEGTKKNRTGFSPQLLKDMLKLGDLPEYLPDHRILRPNPEKKPRIAVETEQGIFAIIKYPEIEGSIFRIPPLKEVTIYLPFVDVDNEFENEPLLKEYVESERPVFVTSLRGFGETLYQTAHFNEDFTKLYSEDYLYASYCLMYDFPFAGRRVYDLLRVVQLLKSCGYESFELVGRGPAALSALYAAPFIPEVKKVRIKNCIPSFEDMVVSDLHLWPMSVLIPDLLLHFDLPDIVEHLKKEKEVEIIEPWDANLKSGGE